MSDVQAELTGTVWKVMVEPGQSVDEGDTLIILESMKMEIPVLAPDPCTVASVLVKEGDIVEEGQTLVIVEDASTSQSLS